VVLLVLTLLEITTAQQVVIMVEAAVVLAAAVRVHSAHAAVHITIIIQVLPHKEKMAQSVSSILAQLAVSLQLVLVTFNSWRT
jgi:hypothetical protein